MTHEELELRVSELETCNAELAEALEGMNEYNEELEQRHREVIAERNELGNYNRALEQELKRRSEIITEMREQTVNLKMNSVLVGNWKR